LICEDVSACHRLSSYNGFVHSVIRHSKCTRNVSKMKKLDPWIDHVVNRNLLF
jgi:hypothetical protein